MLQNLLYVVVRAAQKVGTELKLFPTYLRSNLKYRQPRFVYCQDNFPIEGTARPD